MGRLPCRTCLALAVQTNSKIDERALPARKTWSHRHREANRTPPYRTPVCGMSLLEMTSAIELGLMYSLSN